MIAIKTADNLLREYDHFTTRRDRRRAARRHDRHSTTIKAGGGRHVGLIDSPNVRDIKVGAPRKSVNLPLQTTNWKRSGRKMTNQLQTMRCSAYGTECAKGTVDSCEAMKPIYHNPLELWDHQMETGASEKHGDTIQNAVHQLYLHGFYTDGKHYTITEYRRFTGGTQDLMLWLALGRTVVTGVYLRKDAQYGTNFKRHEFSKDGTLHISSGQKIGGHLVSCVDYETRDDGVWFFFPNSYGEEFGRLEGVYAGGMWIHESEIDNTMSKFLLFDTRDDL